MRSISSLFSSPTFMLSISPVLTLASLALLSAGCGGGDASDLARADAGGGGGAGHAGGGGDAGDAGDAGGAGGTTIGPDACAPATSCPAGKNCGTVPDGCNGAVSCGTCSLLETCTSNVCVSSCTPATSCPAEKNCGTISDGCNGTLNCGSCGAGQMCIANVCGATTTIGPSCAGGLTCGSVSCCDAKLVPGSTGGTLPMGRSVSGADQCPTWGAPCDATELPEHSAMVSDFRLDTFEVTVGRFRKFVAAYPGSKPVAGAGANPKIGTSSGWNTSWPLPTDQAALIASLKCGGGWPNAMWTDIPGGFENKPINCVDWYTAFAFCAWDQGRLPTEAEWEYAAAGASENRLLPWVGTAAPDCLHANLYGCNLPSAISVKDVGSTPLGASKWGQQDLAGNVSEWILDYMADYTSTTCNDCANVSTGTYRIARGGNCFGYSLGTLRAATRKPTGPANRQAPMGFRCARTP